MLPFLQCGLNDMSRQWTLYFCNPGRATAAVAVASVYSSEWNPRQPGLWHVLLGAAAAAHGQEAELLGFPRSAVLYSGASEALERLASFHAFMAAHPLIYRGPEVLTMLEGVLVFLREQLNEAGGAHSGAVLACVCGDGQISELACLSQWFAESQAKLSELMGNGSQHKLDRHFDIDRRYLDVTFGRAWVMQDRAAGMATFKHPYFERLPWLYADGAQRAPHTPSFDAFRSAIAHTVALPLPAPPKPFNCGSIHGAQWDEPWDETVSTQVGGSFVRKDGLWGYREANGGKQPCVFDSFDNDDAADYGLMQKGWRVRRDGRAGWLHPSGILEVDCEWDDVMPYHADGLFGVCRDGRWGLMARGNRQWLPCEYLSVKPLAMADRVKLDKFTQFTMSNGVDWPTDFDTAACLAKASKKVPNLYVAVERESGTGLVDERNNVLIPCAYRRIEAFNFENYRESRWLRLVDNDGRFGLWSIKHGKASIACAHEWLEMIVARGLDQPLVATFNQGKYRYWHGDGSSIGDCEYLWLSEHMNGGIPEADHDRRFWAGALREAWCEGRMVRAVAVDSAHPDGHFVHFSKDVGPRAERDILLEAWHQRGDRHAAMQLAENARYGFYEPKDAPAVRLWRARACGHEPAPGSAVAPERHQHYVPWAALRFAQDLDEGRGGPRDAVLARQWAERAVIEGGGLIAVELLLKLLLDPEAGQPDPERVIRMVQSEDANSRAGMRMGYYHARCLMEGLGVRQDLAAARELFYRTDLALSRLSAPALVQVLTAMAAQAAPQEVPQLLEEAAYFQRKHDDPPYGSDYLI